jgi:hypothetical protein
MAYPHTPRRLGARPALHPTASSPNLSLNASKNIARQASLSALVGGQQASPSSRMGADGRDIGVGDLVDVPGGMNGVVKFVGGIRGKQGVFAGVELSREYAARGKNDGAVDGYALSNVARIAPVLIPMQHAVLPHLRARLWHLPPYTPRAETGLSRLIGLSSFAYHAVVRPQLQSLDHGEAQLQPRYAFHAHAEVLTVSWAWGSRT